MEEITIKKGAWSPEEDQKLKDYVMRFGIWNWNLMPKFAGLSRTGKSCRLRWMNYLHPDVKRGPFTMEERETVIKMHQQLGNRWAAIAGKLPGRTDNEVKNFFHTHLKKHLGQKNIIDAPVKSRRVRKPKKKAAQEKPQLFVDISKTWSNMNTTNLMISPMGGSSSLSSCSIITFDQNEKIDEPNPMIDIEKTVILESNPAATTTHHHQSSSHSNIDSFDQFVDTTSFWLHLLNDADRFIL